MTHGDDQGLILPPRLAPIQIVLIPIYKNDTERSTVMPVVERIKAELAEFRLKVDDRTEVTPGFKFNDGEMRGVPLRIEIGPKDVEKRMIALARRDKHGREGKSFVPQAGFSQTVSLLLEEVQASMLAQATTFRDSHIHDPKDYGELQEVVASGWAFSWWCGDKECEAKVKEDTKASTRCIPLEQSAGKGKCIVCGKTADKKVLFARAY